MKFYAPPLLAISIALAGCASSESDLAKLDATHQMAKTEAGLPNDVESSVRQAQALRLAGRYDEAVRMLSQVMLVASDDPRVLGEYGKTLAEVTYTYTSTMSVYLVGNYPMTNSFYAHPRRAPQIARTSS